MNHVRLSKKPAVGGAAPRRRLRLGDGVKAITDALGIPQCDGCAERQQFLNDVGASWQDYLTAAEGVINPANAIPGIIAEKTGKVTGDIAMENPTVKDVATTAVNPLGSAISSLFGPSPADQAAFDQISKKWDALEKWGIDAHVPNAIPEHTDWIAFKGAWQSVWTRDLDLHGQTGNVEIAENWASDMGYPGPYDPAKDAASKADPSKRSNYGTTTKVHVPSAEEQSAALKGAKKVEDVVGPYNPPKPGAMPWYYKAAIAAGVLGALVLGVRIAK